MEASVRKKKQLNLRLSNFNMEVLENRSRQLRLSNRGNKIMKG
jgi:hypothetical protein